jgi:hypothetical protein
MSPPSIPRILMPASFRAAERQRNVRSTAHSDADIEATLAAAERAVR